MSGEVSGRASQVGKIVRQCEELPGSVEDHPFGEQPTVYKVGGKMFAVLLGGDSPNVSVKLDPEEGLALRAQFPEQIQPGYHLNKRHWNTIVLDGGLDEDEVLGLVRQSYDLIVASLPRRSRPEQAAR